MTAALSVRCARLLAVVLSGALIDGCSSPHAGAATRVTALPTSNAYHRCSNPTCSAFNVLPVVAKRVRYGFACAGDVGPYQTPNPVEPPIEYAARDVGKPGFPALTSRESRTLERVEASYGSSSLKIAWLGRAPASLEFVVFDDPGAPCTGESLGSRVLNGYCNEYYKPAENPYRTFAAPGESIPECRPSPTSR